MPFPSWHSGLSRESSADSSCVSIEERSNAEILLALQKTSDETVQSTCNKQRNVIIGSVISHCVLITIILILSIYLLNYQGKPVPSNHQKDEKQCPPVTCPSDWIGHQGYCYKLSREEKNWIESQDFCIFQNASLAKITDKEMDFVTTLSRNHVYWIGLKREQDQPWKWLDGEHSTLKVLGNGGDCAYLNDDATASSGRCSTKHRYICKKKLILKRS